MNSIEISINKYPSYPGTPLNDQVHGKGIYTWGNGDRYEGLFLNGKMRQGILTYADGRKLEGVFFSERNFQGMLTYANGKSLKGDFIFPGHVFLDPENLSTTPTSSFPLSEDPFLEKMRAVVLRANYDYNGAFGGLETDVTLVQKLSEAGYSTRLIQLNASNELEGEIQKLSLGPVQLIWIRAHGAQQSISFGENDNARIDDLKPLLNLTDKKPRIVLQCCNTGKPSLTHTNLAENIVDYLSSQKKEPIVIAPNAAGAMLGMRIDQSMLHIAMYDTTGKRVEQIFQHRTSFSRQLMTQKIGLWEIASVAAASIAVIFSFALSPKNNF